MPDADPILLELYRHRFAGVAEERGGTLRRTNYSPNIKERLDFSCAVFDADGGPVAQAAHIPVYLGAMPASVCAALDAVDGWPPGDVVILNDPYAGDTGCRRRGMCRSAAAWPSRFGGPASGAVRGATGGPTTPTCNRATTRRAGPT